MKTKILALLSSLICLFAIFAFAGCAGKRIEKGTLDGKDCIIINVDTVEKDMSFADYMQVLKDEGKLKYEGEVGAYGLFLTSLNGVENVSTDNGYKGTSWMLYIDFDVLDDVIYADSDTYYEYNGKKLYSSMNGASGTPCLEGHTYVWVYEDYDYTNFN